MTTQPLKLSLQGVPLEALPGLRGPDYGAGSGYGLARSEFLARRGAGTPLLPASAQPTDPGPHPALREFLVASMVNKLNTGDPLAATQDQRTLLAEAHMAFMQYLGELVADVAQRGVEPPPDPESSHGPRWDLPTGATLGERPLWLSTVLAARHARAEPEPAQPLPDRPAPAEADPARYASESGAVYREVLTPATELGRGQGAGRIDPVLTLKRLIAEKVAITIEPDAEAPNRFEVTPIPPQPSDPLTISVAGEDRGARRDRLALEAMQLAAGANPTDDGAAYEVYVFTPDTVDQCLSRMDVMRGFEWARAVGSPLPSPDSGRIRLVDEFGNPILGNGRQVVA